MTATVEEVLALADVKQCLKDTGVDSTYGHCHNACVWLIMQIKKAGVSDYNIWLNTGTFWGKDHSWLVVTEADPEDINEEIYTVIDMTVDQFVPTRKVPFSGPQTDEYDATESVLLCMDEELLALVNRLG